MPRTKKQIQELKKTRKEQILREALELFAMKGYHATSIDGIARKAGISKGLVYNYFQSKLDLLLQLIKSVFDKIDTLFPATDPQNLTEQDLIELVYRTVNMLKTDLREYRLYFMLYYQFDIEDFVRPLSREYIEKVVSYLTPYYEKKGVKNPRAHILAFISALDGLALHYIFFQYPEIDEMVEIIIDKYIKL